MPDREKVFDAFRNCITEPKCKDCPWETCEKFHQAKTIPLDLCMDILNLLKEQKHWETFTVIDTKTGKEADEYEIALHEDWAKHLCYCDIEGWAIENDGTLLLVDECGRFAYADRERFKVIWDA